MDERKRLPRTVSREGLQEAGLDLEDRNAELFSELNVRIILEELEKTDPLYVQIVGLKLNGKTAREISRELRVSYDVVNYAIGKIRKIAGKYFE